MKKPNSKLIALIKLGYISGLSIDYRQTGVDTAETYCTITGRNGTVKGLWSTWSGWLVVRVDYKSVAHVREEYIEEYRAWKDFEAENAEDLATYHRLKKKFERN